jgi:hypothetical protein
MAGIKNTKIIPYEECHKVINNIIYKMCSICENWFVEDENNFYKNNPKDKECNKYHPYCKSCEIEKNMKRNYDNYDDMIKSQIKYNKSPKRKSEMRERAKQQREDGEQEQWRKDHPEKVREYTTYRSMHKTHNITTKEWRDCKNYFNNTCAYCGLPIEKHYHTYAKKLILFDFCKDHKDNKGANDLSNCIPACKSCNGKKWEFQFDEWYNKGNPVYFQKRYDKIIKWINEDYMLYKETR